MTKFLVMISVSAILLAMVAVVAMPKPKVNDDPYSSGYWTREKLKEVPLSQHAAEGPHNPGAALIQSWMVAGQCKPLKVYACPFVKQVKFVCPSLDRPDDQQNGLIVGLENQANPGVVTGFDSRSSYWGGTMKRDWCLGPFYVP